MEGSVYTMIRKLLLAVVLMLSVAITGCSSNSTTSKPAEDTKNTESIDTKNEDSSLDENSDVKEDVKEEQEKIPSTENKSSAENNVTKATLSVYSEDPNTMEIKQTSSIEVNENESLKNKLSQLAQAISTSNFNGLPIEIKSIDTIDGKKIATINLAETSNNRGITNPSELKSPNWRSNFQGSAGGQITSDSLLETFLQVKYKGEWIDGVKFLYENENIEFEHVSNLSQIQYRNN